MIDKNFCKNWLKELRSQVQPVVKAAKRKRPSLTIIAIGEHPEVKKIIDDCKFVGCYVDSYEIPVEEYEENKGAFQQLLIDIDSDAIWLAQDAVGMVDPIKTVNGSQYYNTPMAVGVSTYLKSLNTTPGVALCWDTEICKVLLKDGWAVICPGVQSDIDWAIARADAVIGGSWLEGKVRDGATFINLDECDELERCGLVSNVIKAWEAQSNED